MSLKEKILDSLARVAKANPKGRRYDEFGRYHPDPTPIAPPVGYVRSPSLSEQIRAMVRSEALRQAADQAGADTFEEADDFDVGDDYDPRSPFEEQFEGEFSEPINQAPVARDPDDRNPPTPPPPQTGAGGGGEDGGVAQTAPPPGPPAPGK